MCWERGRWERKGKERKGSKNKGHVLSRKIGLILYFIPVDSLVGNGLRASINFSFMESVLMSCSVMSASGQVDKS